MISRENQLTYIVNVNELLCHIYVMRKVWIGTIRRLSCAIYGSTNCAIICRLRMHAIHGLYRAQSMDQDNPWIVLRKLWIPMDCTYVPCAKGLDCMHTTVNPRIVPGGRQSIDRMYDYSLHKAWAAEPQACREGLPFLHAGFCYRILKSNHVRC